MEPETRTPLSAAAGMAAVFVRRPVLALVVNLLIAVAGLAAWFGVEIRELPEVDSPVISVSTEFPGASAETVDRELTARIEGAAARTPGVVSISSNSSFAHSQVTVEFAASADIDVAASDLRDAIVRISRDLPEAAEDSRIVKADANAQAIMRLALTSDTMAVEDMTILAEEQIADRLSAVRGVADVQIYGDREKVFRIDIDQARLASRGLTVADLAGALADAAFDAPAGSLTNESQDILVRATAPIRSAGEFEAILIRDNTRIGDVASVSLGPDPGVSALRANGRAGVGLGIVRQAGSNALVISEGVRKAVGGIAATLPRGVELKVTSDDASFIEGALDEVAKALGLSLLIVVGVIFLFLRDLRATVIPAAALPIALIGALAAVWLAGFSVNILTLLALVLATGLVVDDAIVVLENIVSRRASGMAPRAAAVVGTREVFFAVVATTATLIAVFVPIAFLPGKAGALFREFGFVLAISVFLSAIVALTLCPMLASRLLRPHKGGATDILARFGDGALSIYRPALRASLSAPARVIAASLAAIAIAAALYAGLRRELTPPEDRAVVLLSLSAPQGVNLEYTSRQMAKIEELVEPLRARGEVGDIFAIAGRGGSASGGFMVLRLAPWQERQRSQQQIVAEVGKLAAAVPGIRAFAIQPNSLGIRGAGSGLQVAIVGDDYETLARAGEGLVRRMEDDGRFGRVRLSYETTQPQLSIAIDRDKASDLSIRIEGLAPVLQTMLDGRALGAVFLGDRAVEVKLVSSAEPLDDPTDLENLFLKTGDGRIVPMSSIATIEEKAVAPSLSREQKQRSVSVTASLAPDFALKSALERAGELAGPLLPAGARLIPLAEAATLEETSNNLATTFGFAFVVILLVLAAQFESFVSAFIILLTVPLGLACAVFAMAATGTSLNVYSQIGLLLMVGIMAKNGILIVDFANQLRDRGTGIREAIEQAAIRRLRPVVMTMLSTQLGALPLVLAHGAGAEARIALGWVMVGGLGLATVTTLFLTPVAYLLIARFATPNAKEAERLERELAAASANP